MSLPQGKADPATMHEAVYGSLGRRSRRVIVGPRLGFDNAVLAVQGRTRMIVTTDPVSIIPEVGMKTSAWLSVHLIASDYTTSGRRPEFANFCFNFPLTIAREDAIRYLRAVGDECKKLGVAIVGGHTGSYRGSGFTVVGGGSMFGFCKKGEYVDPSMARAGDAILMTKGAAIEAAATLAWSFPGFTEERAGKTRAVRARRLLTECSTVKDALTASSVGLGRDGVTSMHDATEGGVLGALGEMSQSSNKAFVVEKDQLYVPPESEAVCSAFRLDPLTSLSEGTLLLTCAISMSDELIRSLQKSGITAFAVGRVREGSGLWMSKQGGAAKRVMPAADDYWKAYELSIKSGLK